MNKKGFTLIELLAVIVILGVIMLIAVPQISRFITKSKIESLRVSADGIARAAELYRSSNETSDEIVKFSIVNGEETGTNKLNYKGKIDSGTVMIYSEDKLAFCLTKERYTAIKNINDNEILIKEGSCLFNEETQTFESKEYCGDFIDELNEYKSQGDAEESDILIGKKALVNGNLITGSMANHGELNWNPAESTTYNVLPGYYSGGTISSSAAYDSGKNSVVSPNTGIQPLQILSGYDYSPTVVLPCYGYKYMNIYLPNNATYQKGIYVYGWNGTEWILIVSAGGVTLNSNNNDISNYSLIKVYVTDKYAGTVSGLIGLYGNYSFYN